MRLTQSIETKRGFWLRGLDLNQRPLGYEPNELPGCSTPHLQFINCTGGGQITGAESAASQVAALSGTLSGTHVSPDLPWEPL